MNWTFRNRITWINTFTVALLMAAVFGCIYTVVHFSSFKHLDDDINAEKEEVLSNLVIENREIIIYKMPEWEEAEHKQLEANPTFIQIIDMQGAVLFSSSNLRGEKFLYKFAQKENLYFNGKVNGQRLRFGQFAIMTDDNVQIGHLTIAISRQESYVVLRNLLASLVISYLLLLIFLFSTLWFVTSKAILPITQLSLAASGINEATLSTRLPLPKYKDEIYVLAHTFNELLERLERALVHQKQFTADMSHELRTPLTAIKGALEVMLRRERTPQHYIEKIKGVLEQTNRLTGMYDDMLTLSNFENSTFKVANQPCQLLPIFQKLLDNYDNDIKKNNIKVTVTLPETVSVKADANILNIIFSNLLTNALKYNTPNGSIDIAWNARTHTLTIADTGIGIAAAHLPHIFNRFYRAESSRLTTIKGYGLGLAIVKKLCVLQDIQIAAKSEVQVGTTFTLQFAS